jgi:hypothetical protein
MNFTGKSLTTFFVKFPIPVLNCLQGYPSVEKYTSNNRVHENVSSSGSPSRRVKLITDFSVANLMLLETLFEQCVPVLASFLAHQLPKVCFFIVI